MLQIKNLTIVHRKDLRTILEGFNLVLNDGDKAVIIGEEGNGKSTLLKWIYDSSMVEEYTESTGEKVVNNEKLGYLPQELQEVDKSKTVYEYFSEEESFYDKTAHELSEMAVEFGVPVDFYYREQRVSSLSGGEKIKAQLMRILMGNPSVLLLDEPSNDVDINTLELLEKLINNWKHSVLFISHDETLIENTANIIIHLEQIYKKTKSRYTIAKNNYKDYIFNRMNEFEKQKQMALNDRREKKQRDEKYQRILQSVNRSQVTIGSASKDLGDKMQAARNLKDKMHAVKSMGRRFEKQDEKMTEMPEMEEAIFFKLGSERSFVYPGKKIIEIALDELRTIDSSKLLAKNISFKVRGAEKICIVGANGVGKTTLLKRIYEELKERNDIKVQYMPQDYGDILDLDVTPIEYLDDSGEKSERTRIRTFLGALKYTTEEMEHPIRELSGGQKAKILLLKMSLSDANVLVLDEPTRNFSPLSGPVLRKMLASFPGTIISISHDRKYIKEVCSKVYTLSGDGLVEKNNYCV